MTTGISNADTVWTNGWELHISLPASAVGPKVSLSFKHTAAEAGSYASDVAIDNVVITGGTCGTSLACVCHDGSIYTEKGEVASATTAWLSPMESYSETTVDMAPGYVDELDMTCAHCTIQSRSGAVYTRWGNSSCPAGHTQVYSGFMAGPRNDQASAGGEYMCVTADMGLGDFSIASQVSTATDIYRVEYVHNGGLSWMSSLNHMTLCAVCARHQAEHGQ
jgi:hypothetical protein